MAESTSSRRRRFESTEPWFGFLGVSLVLWLLGGWLHLFAWLVVVAIRAVLGGGWRSGWRGGVPGLPPDARRGPLRHGATVLGGFAAAYVLSTAFSYVATGGVIDHERPRWRIEAVEPGSPADGVLRVGDEILQVGEARLGPGAPHPGELLDRSEGRSTRLTVLREGEEIELHVSPVHDETIDRYRLGVGLGLDHERLRGAEALAGVLTRPWKTIREFSSIWLGLPGKEPQPTGPIGIAEISQPDPVQSVTAYSLSYLFAILGALFLICDLALFGPYWLFRKRHAPASP